MHANSTSGNADHIDEEGNPEEKDVKYKGKTLGIS